MAPVENLSSGLDDIEDLGRNAEASARLQNRIRIRVSAKSQKLAAAVERNCEDSKGKNCNGPAVTVNRFDQLTWECVESYVIFLVFYDSLGNEDSSTDSNDFRPSDYKVYLKTWGCSHNSSDSEYMAGLLHSYGFKVTDIREDAHVWVLNSCTVKNPAEDHFKNELTLGRKSGKSLVLAGCVPQAAPREPFVKGLSIIGVQQIDRIIEVVEETLKGNCVRILGQKKAGRVKLGGSDLSLPKIRKNPLIEIIPISTGCLNQCTYCKTKFARGNLGSYPADEIIARAQQAFQEGVKEIWLTSEDTGAWGIDLGSSIAELLKELVKVLPRDSMLRIGMTNPPYILDHLEAVAEILNHPQVYSFLHVPVQAGSDSVLGDMKREYCIEEFQRVVDFIMEKVPGATIATDIICGFPTETDDDFKETLELCSKNRFKALFINQFYPRKGTPAANMQKIDTRDVKKRTKALTELFNSYLPYENRIGQIYDVLVTEISHDKLHYVGHNKFYEQILVPQIPELMGKWARVKIVTFCKHSMTGAIISYGDNKDCLETTPFMSTIRSASTATSFILGRKHFFIIFFIITVVLVKFYTLFFLVK